MITTRTLVRSIAIACLAFAAGAPAIAASDADVIREARGEAVGGTLHMTANHYVEFIDKDHARLHNYWLTAFVPPAVAAGAARPEQRVPATGRGVDELVRVKGKWLIKSRDVSPKD